MAETRRCSRRNRYYRCSSSCTTRVKRRRSYLAAVLSSLVDHPPQRPSDSVSERRTIVSEPNTTWFRWFETGFLVFGRGIRSPGVYYPPLQLLFHVTIPLFRRSTVIAACDRGGAWDICLWMLEEAREEHKDAKGGRANVFAYTAAISACGKAGHWEEAVSLLDVRNRKGAPLRHSRVLVAVQSSRLAAEVSCRAKTMRDVGHRRLVLSFRRGLMLPTCALISALWPLLTVFILLTTADAARLRPASFASASPR